LVFWAVLPVQHIRLLQRRGSISASTEVVTWLVLQTLGEKEAWCRLTAITYTKKSRIQELPEKVATK
jgi:hypothetical protein